MDISNLTKKRIIDYLENGKRFDGRKLLELRDIKIETGISKNAEGSARVKLGETEVLVGVKMDVGTPYTDSPEAGALITSAELLPMSSPKYEPGPPKFESIEVARLVDRAVRESGFIDFDKLCIKKGEKVWTILLDIYSINDAGNLVDAAVMAAIVALKTSKMPKYDEETEKVKFGEWTNQKVPVTDNLPITMTFHKLGKAIILDPITEEEETSDARLTLAVSAGKDPKIHACQKGNEIALTEEEVFNMIDSAIEKAKEIKTKLDKF